MQTQLLAGMSAVVLNGYIPYTLLRSVIREATSHEVSFYFFGNPHDAVHLYMDVSFESSVMVFMIMSAIVSLLEVRHATPMALPGCRSN